MSATTTKSEYTCSACGQRVEWQSHEAAAAMSDHACRKPVAEAPKRGNKYHAEPVTIDGYRFASKAEGRRYEVLRLREKAGEITNLEVHPAFDLHVNEIKIGRYTADFRYIQHGFEHFGDVVEDVKSGPTRTREFKRTKKHLKAEYGIEIEEVIGND
jgi:hypothetical protein